MFLRNGFSLVELIFVLGIIALLLAICLPGMNRFSSRLYLDASAKSIASELRSLQGQAMLEHKSMSYDINNLKLPHGVKIIKASSLRFASSGFPPPGGSGSIVLKDLYGHSLQIVLSSAGRTRVE